MNFKNKVDNLNQNMFDALHDFEIKFKQQPVTIFIHRLNFNLLKNSPEHYRIDRLMFAGVGIVQDDHKTKDEIGVCGKCNRILQERNDSTFNIVWDKIKDDTGE